MKHEEFWLAVLFVDDSGQTDLLWYNEGNREEYPYFLKLLEERLNGKQKSRMQFEIQKEKFII